MKEPLELLFVIDPIEKLSIKKDTSFAFMIEAQQRGHDVHVAAIGDLFAEGRHARAETRHVQLARVEGAHYEWLDEPRVRDLSEFDLVFMRKDPPFDMEYVFATYVLSLASEAGTRVINDPRGLRDCNEKAYILNFPELIPATLMTRRAGRIKAFVEEHGDSVIKPLDGKGGEGILMLREGDLNINSIIEVLTRYEQRFVMVQRFVPQAREGDKRVLMIDGEPVGAFLRVPATDDLRGNMSAGATVAAWELTARDFEICEAIRPRLEADGHVFVGIDIIGDVLTEINVTSPTGVQEAHRLGGVDVAAKMVAWIEDNV